MLTLRLFSIQNTVMLLSPKLVLFEARIQDLSDLTSSFLTFFTHFLKWAPAASGRPLSGARARYRWSTPLPSSPLSPPRTARAQQPLRAAQRLPKRPYGPPEEGLVAPLGMKIKFTRKLSPLENQVRSHFFEIKGHDSKIKSSRKSSHSKIKST